MTGDTQDSQKLESEFKKTLSGFVDSEALSQSDIEKIWKKFATSDEAGKKEALSHLNEAWMQFEKTSDYIARLSNEDSFEALQNLDAKYGATVTFNTEILELTAQQAENEAQQAEEEVKKQELQSLNSQLSSKSTKPLSLDELIGNAKPATPVPTSTFTHSADLKQIPNKVPPSSVSGSVPLVRPPQLNIQPNQPRIQNPNISPNPNFNSSYAPNPNNQVHQNQPSYPSYPTYPVPNSYNPNQNVNSAQNFNSNNQAHQNYSNGQPIPQSQFRPQQTQPLNSNSAPNLNPNQGNYSQVIQSHQGIQQPLNFPYPQQIPIPAKPWTPNSGLIRPNSAPNPNQNS